VKIDVDEDRNIRLREVFNGVKMETAEGNAIGVCMRDDTLEINVMPGGKHTGNWWRVNMQTGQIESMPNTTNEGVPLNSLVRPSSEPVNRMIDAVVKCTKCGAGYGQCECWTQCRCGWSYERGGQCRNPVHKTGVFTSESEPNHE